MRLVFHGGKCCGMKHIYGFHDGPAKIQPALERVATFPEAHTEAMKYGVRNHDSSGVHVNSDLDFFTDEAPEERADERLQRLIDFCRKHRKYGIIEVVLAGWCYANISKNGMNNVWGPIVVDKGFNLVSSCMNSNSGNRIFVYHLCIDKE